MTPQQVIHEFYSAFQKRDWAAMQSCYHADIEFTDPVFLDLKGKKARAMWHMLSESARDLKIEFGEVAVSVTTGSCRWEAWYPFSKTGRPVHNRIRAHFEFRDGKIVRHQDHFDLWRWSGMALGFPGKALGWSPWMKGKIRQMASKNLNSFIANHPEYQ
jgi:ketosteroid isomerase-like protein